MTNIKTFVYLGSDEDAYYDFYNIEDKSEVIKFYSHEDDIINMEIIYETDREFVGLRVDNNKIIQLNKDEVFHSRKKVANAPVAITKIYSYEASCCDSCDIFRNINDYTDEIEVVGGLVDGNRIIMMEGSNGSLCLIETSGKSVVVPTSVLILEDHECKNLVEEFEE